MQPELSRVIEQVSKEKGIDRSIVVGAIEAAMLSAARKMMPPTTQLEAKFNPEIGEVELFKILTVVEQVNDPEIEIRWAMSSWSASTRATDALQPRRPSRT
jgi:N utilization substance protein A